LRHHPTHLGTVLSGRNPVTLTGQIFLDEVADFALVVDNQDVTIVSHAGELSLPLDVVFPRR
jgi:hypothetical protein